jgi:hypothetical protein
MKTYYRSKCRDVEGAHMNIDTEIYLFILFSLLCLRATTITISRILIVRTEKVGGRVELESDKPSTLLCIKA